MPADRSVLAVEQALSDAARSGQPAVIQGGEVLSWAQLAARVDAHATHRGSAAHDDAMLWVCTAPEAADPVAPLVDLLAALCQRRPVVLPHPRWPDALAAEVRARLDGYELSPSADAQTILFTSGSSGHPKAVVHDVGQHLAAARASHRRVPFGPGDRWLLSLPLCHVGGLAIVFRALTASAALELPCPEERATDALVRARPTHVSLVAAQLSALLASPEGVEALRGCREIMVGGGPVAPDLIARAASAGIALRQTYGATELCAQACTSSAGAPSSCGEPLDGIKIRIDDDGGIAVRSPFALRGYLGAQGLMSALDDQGFWRSGDIGRIDDDGGLVVTGRADHRFISGGENIHPEMIEAALVALPEVQQAVVVDVADPQFGARPAAFVLAPALTLRDDGAVPPALRDALAARLPRFMLPVALWPLQAPAGLKPQRAQLRAIARRRHP